MSLNAELEKVCLNLFKLVVCQYIYYNLVRKRKSHRKMSSNMNRQVTGKSANA
jgi:hypothetical protein